MTHLINTSTTRLGMLIKLLMITMALFSSSSSLLLVRSFTANVVINSPHVAKRISTRRVSSSLLAFHNSSLHRIPFSSIGTRLHSTTEAAKEEEETKTKDDDENEKKIPITLLAGFLGSGKTTTLQNLLTNNEGMRIGVVVNDVASVNIDQKLISNTQNEKTIVAGDDTVELQNGCACCSLADDFLISIEQLVSSKNKQGGERRRDLDAIVVELSGVADPVAVRKNWEKALLTNHEATKYAEFKNVVTLVDSSTFGTDWMSFDSTKERDGWVDPNDDDCPSEKKVPELLAEQVEAADILVINKVDLVGKEQLKTATAVAKNLNEKAEMFEVEFGKMSIEQILVNPTKKGKEEEEEEKNSHSHGHDHDHTSHDHESSTSDCSEPGCTDTSHSHSHDHESSTSDCTDPGCTDTSHSHSHDHESSTDCTDPGCTDTSHSHSHNHESTSDCTDPGCTDTSHSHSHDHESSHSHSHDHDHASTSTANLNITNFVYKQTRPFHSIRLMALLNFWPIPIKDTLDLGAMSKAAREGYADGEDDEEMKHVKSPFAGVLRSKGFCWLSPTVWHDSVAGDIWRHDTAMYWSHAGKHFGLNTAGQWWGSISKEQMKMYFNNNTKEYERILTEDFVTEEWGDRRQELVFIGTGIDEKEITDALDECLCTDEEMVSYREQVKTFFGDDYSS
jgi:G3E family GTPase